MQKRKGSSNVKVTVIIGYVLVVIVMAFGSTPFIKTWRSTRVKERVARIFGTAYRE